jgi:three-Cys-motif partner protein
MGRDNHTWRLTKDPPLIRAHSLAKHRVLRSYLERYVSVLTSNPRQDQLKLTLIDGFAGGGIYLDSITREHCFGSPLIMLEAMEASAELAQRVRSKPFNLDVQYFFIEKRRESLEYLTRTIKDSKYKSQLTDSLHLLKGDFESHVSHILEFIKKRGTAGRAIFVLDQCGYLDVPLSTIRLILSELENAEVILTFATDFLISYLTEHPSTQQILSKIGLSLPSESIKSAKNHREWRRIIQFALHQQIPDATGADYYTPFFIRSKDSGRDLWLIHLSKHSKARDVMVGLHWQESTHFAHYGRSGLQMLGYDETRDEGLTKQHLLPGFYFDETALLSSQDALFDQLPKRIFDTWKEGVPFHQLFASLTNECPVTSEIMKDVMAELAREGEFRIVTAKGAARRNIIGHSSDIIIPSKQKRLFLR